MRSKYILLFIISFIFIFGCKEEIQEYESLDSFTVEYEMNSGWTGYSFKAMLNQHGNLKINEIIALNHQQRESAFTIQPTDLLMVKEKLNALIRIEPKDKYGFDISVAPPELPVKKLNFETNLRTDSVAFHFLEEKEMPVELYSFLESYLEIIAKYDTLHYSSSN